MGDMNDEYIMWNATVVKDGWRTTHDVMSI